MWRVTCACMLRSRSGQVRSRLKTVEPCRFRFRRHWWASHSTLQCKQPLEKLVGSWFFQCEMWNIHQRPPWSLQHSMNWPSCVSLSSSGITLDIFQQSLPFPPIGSFVLRLTHWHTDCFGSELVWDPRGAKSLWTPFFVPIEKASQTHSVSPSQFSYFFHKMQGFC